MEHNGALCTLYYRGVPREPKATSAESLLFFYSNNNGGDLSEIKKSWSKTNFPKTSTEIGKKQPSMKIEEQIKETMYFKGIFFLIKSWVIVYFDIYFFSSEDQLLSSADK